MRIFPIEPGNYTLDNRSMNQVVGSSRVMSRQRHRSQHYSGECIQDPHEFAILITHSSNTLDALRQTGTLRVTPAMTAGVMGRLWEVSDLLALLEGDKRG